MGWSRAFHMACMAGAFALCACSADDRARPSRLDSIELPVTEESPAIWERQLSSGIYLIESREKDIDVVMTIDSSARRVQLAEDMARYGYKATIVRLDVPARLRLEMSNVDHMTKKGGVALTVTRLRDLDGESDHRELTYAFLSNGSRSVIASLWPIEDASTASFMEQFYAAYRHSGRAAEALQIAQLRTRNDPTNGVWSAFVVRANELP
jgi:hypothetical protein